MIIILGLAIISLTLIAFQDCVVFHLYIKEADIILRSNLTEFYYKMIPHNNFVIISVPILDKQYHRKIAFLAVCDYDMLCMQYGAKPQKPCDRQNKGNNISRVTSQHASGEGLVFIVRVMVTVSH